MKSPKRLTAITATVALFFATATSVSVAWADAPEKETPLRSALDARLFYEVLVSEISARDGDIDQAFNQMLASARRANSQELYQRAVGIALGARAGGLALQGVQAWVKAFPASRDASRLQLQILVGLNRINETVEPLKRELANYSGADKLQAIGLMPRYFAEVTDKKLAASVLEKALSAELTKAETGPAAWASVGLMQLSAGDTDAALQSAQKGAALNPKAQQPIVLALGLIGGEKSRADALVQQYLTLQAGADPDLHMAYVRKLLDANRSADVRSEIQALTTTSAQYPNGWLVRGSLEFQNKDHAAAQTSFNKYLSLSNATMPSATAPVSERGSVQALYLLAQMAQIDNRLDDAMRYLDAIDDTQDKLFLATRRAAVMAKQGKLDAALALLAAVPEQRAPDARAKIFAQAQLLRDNKQHVAAYALLGKASQSDPSDVDLAYEWALAAEKIGQLDVMEQLLTQIIASNPRYHQAYNALGYSLADRKMRLPEARQYVAKALEFAPNDPYIVDSMAWVEFRSGNYPEALRLLQSAYQKRPDAEIAAHLGEVLWTMNQQTQAQAVWQQGLDLNAHNETLLETIHRLDKR